MLTPLDCHNTFYFTDMSTFREEVAEVWTRVKSDDFRLDLTKSKKTCHNQSLLLKPFDLKVLDSLPQAQSMLFKQINDFP